MPLRISKNQLCSPVLYPSLLQLTGCPGQVAFTGRRKSGASEEAHTIIIKKFLPIPEAAEEV